MTRIGILGGSFDPPHTGHLLVAQDACEALSLDKLLVVPAATQPLKQGRRTAASHRLRMAELCFAGAPGIEVDPIEVHRGGLSFMVDTVETLAGRWPRAELHLLVGEDVIATLPQWREPERLLSMVHLVVLQRGDADAATIAGALADWEGRPGVRSTVRLRTRRVDVSSTEIRARVQDGKSLAGFVPDAVARYIDSAGLYRHENQTHTMAGGDPGSA